MRQKESEVFKSESDQIKYLVMELMKDGKQHSRQDIIKTVESLAGKRFTEGQWSGAIQYVLNQEGYEAVRRGVYQYSAGVKNESPEYEKDENAKLFEMCESILAEAIVKIKEEVGKSSLSQKTTFELNNDDLTAVQKIRTFIDNIEAAGANLKE